MKMFIDKDSWGRFSINDLSERDLRLFYEALRIYAQANLGRIHPEDNVRIFGFSSEFFQALNEKKPSPGNIQPGACVID